MSSVALSQNVNVGGTLNVGGSSSHSTIGQGSNMENRARKGKDREEPEQNTPPDSSKESEADPEPESPDIDESWNAKISFDVASDLHDASDLKLGLPPFQKLQLLGEVMIERTSESQHFQHFATCRTEFTKLQTAATLPSPGGLGYRPTSVHLGVCIDAQERVVEINDIRPYHTQKYHQESKVSSSSKRGWTSSLMAMIAALVPLVTIGTSATHTREQGTSNEKTANISRITQLAMRGKVLWGFYITDPFDQNCGMTLLTEKLPRAHFEFVGRSDIPAPPPEYLNVEISTYWSLLPHHGGNATRILGVASKPKYSNICKIVTLKVPSNLRGRKVYHASLNVWPKQSDSPNAMRFLTTVEHNADPSNLVQPSVVNSDHVFGD